MNCLRMTARTMMVAATLVVAAPVSADTLGIVSIDHPMVIPQGTSEAALVTLELTGDAVGLFGYSLSLQAVPRAGSVGTVSFDVEWLIDDEATNLSLDANLIAAYPAPLDPFFTVVFGPDTSLAGVRRHPWHPERGSGIVSRLIRGASNAMGRTLRA